MKTIHEIPQDERYPFDYFKVGDGATRHLYSDSHAGTVIKVSKNGKRVWIQDDDAKLDPNFKPEIIPGGFVGRCVNQNEQRYTYERNPEGTIREFSIRKWRGRYVWTTKGSNPDGRQEITLGRHKFHDYNF